MKKTLLAITVLSLLAGCATLSTQAVTQTTPERGMIHVSTSANTEIAPDVVEISFAVVKKKKKRRNKE